MPIEYPQNELTRSIEDTAMANRAGGRRAVVASATPQPSVRSADLGRVVEDEAPLTPAEIAERDELARQAGIIDERLGNTEPLPTYPSLEEAVAASAPVAPTRMTAREFLASRERGTPRIPTFSRVEGIDLVHNMVVLDGMTFPLSEAKALELKRLVIEVAQASIMEKLTEAARLFFPAEKAEETDGGTGGSVSAVQPEPARDREEPAV